MTNVISSTNIKETILDKIRENSLLLLNETSISYAEIVKNKDNLAEILAFNSEQDLKCISRNQLKEKLETIIKKQENCSTILGNTRIKFIECVSERKYFERIFLQIREIISVTTVPVQIPVRVAEIPIEQSSNLPVAQIPVAQIEPSIFVKNLLDKQIDRIKSIDNSNKNVEFTATDNLHSDLNTIFNTFNNCKENFDNKKIEYIDSVFSYVKNSVIKKIIEKLLKLREELCPEEFE